MPEYSLDTMAKFICLSPRRVQQLAEDSIIPKPVKGRYDLVSTAQGYIRYLQTLAQGQGSKSLTDERTRNIRIKNAREELSLKKEQGELIVTEQAMKLWGEIVMATRAKILALPTKITPLVCGLTEQIKIKMIIEQEAHGICNELANPDIVAVAKSVYGGDKRGSRDVSPAAKVKRKRVGGRKKVSQPRGKRGAG